MQVYYTIQCRVNEAMIGKLLPSGRDLVEVHVITTVANSFGTQLFTSVPPTVQETLLADRVSALNASLTAANSELQDLRKALSEQKSNVTAGFAALSRSFVDQVAALGTNLTASDDNLSARLSSVESLV